MKNITNKALFRDYIKDENLKNTKQRNYILQILLREKKHLSANELYQLVRKKYPSIGYATIYRTLKLLYKSGLCRQLKLEDGKTKYEHSYAQEHHDHLICLNCGKIIEVFDNQIELLQLRLAKKYEFDVKNHKMELYGFCNKCKKENLKQQGD